MPNGGGEGGKGRCFLFIGTKVIFELVFFLKIGLLSRVRRLAGSIRSVRLK